MSANPNGKPHVTFGVRVPNSGPLATVESMVEVAQEAESLGFDSVWVHDHLTWSEEIHRTHISSGADHSNQGNDSPDFYEAMTSLSYLAGLVRSARLGIACVVVPCRNPLLAAKQIATLDVLCKGRLDIGVGWLPAWLLPEDIAKRFRELKEMAKQQDRDPDAIHLGIEVYGCIDAAPAKARQDGFGTLAIGQSTFERFMSVEQLAEVSLIGSPEEIRRRVKAYSEAGVTHFEIKFIY